MTTRPAGVIFCPPLTFGGTMNVKDDDMRAQLLEDNLVGAGSDFL